MIFKTNKPQTEVAVTVSVKTFAKLIVMVVATIVLLMAIRQASQALLLLFTAFFLALALNAPVNWIGQRLPGKRRGSRALATSISFAVVVVFFGTFLASIVPPLIRQTEGFITAAPRIVSDFKDENTAIGKIVSRYELQDEVNNISGELSERVKNAGGSVFPALQRVGNSFFSLLTILVLTFMMLIEGPGIMRFFHQLIPRKHRPQAGRLGRDMYRVVKGYVNGQVTLAALAAVVIFPALLILDIGYPVAMLVVIFICGLIPMVGHTIGAVIVTLVALSQSTSAALIILGYYILYQQLENIFIQPRIQANSTDMSQLLVFGSVVVGVSFGGLFGGLVAIPIAGCIRIAVLEYLQTQNLIDAPAVEEAVVKSKA